MNRRLPRVEFIKLVEDEDRAYDLANELELRGVASGCIEPDRFEAAFDRFCAGLMGNLEGRELQFRWHRLEGAVANKGQRKLVWEALKDLQDADWLEEGTLEILNRALKSVNTGDKKWMVGTAYAARMASSKSDYVTQALWDATEPVTTEGDGSRVREPNITALLQRADPKEREVLFANWKEQSTEIAIRCGDEETARMLGRVTLRRHEDSHLLVKYAQGASEVESVILYSGEEVTVFDRGELEEAFDAKALKGIPLRQPWQLGDLFKQHLSDDHC